MPITKAPREIVLVGELLSAMPMEKNSKKFVLLTIQDASDKQHTISTSDTSWAKNQRMFPEGTIVSVTGYQNIANETEYEETVAGVATVKKHSTTGVSLKYISRYSMSSWNRMISQKGREADLDIINTVEIDRVNAAAAYLGQTFGR